MKIGPYEIRGEPVRGGMGVVFRALAPDGREVAVKVLAGGDRPRALERFERERRLLEGLGEDAGFVPLLDAGESPQGPWFAMPFLPGKTLRDRLERGRLPVLETLPFAIRIARALGLAHARGIVHRDLKPENILFTRGGVPLVADLGIAKHFDRSAPGASQSVSLSSAGELRGTAGYAAPEQLGGSDVGPEADVFALAAIVFECLSGEAAFKGESAIEVITRVESGTHDSLGKLAPHVPRWLASTIERGLARDRHDRFPDGEAFAAALEAGSLEGERSSTLPRIIIIAVAALGLVAAGGLGGRALLARRTVVAPSSPSPRASPEKVGEREALARLEKASRELLRDCWTAREDASRALELAPDLVAAWELRARASALAGDLKSALDDASRAIALSPERSTAWGARGFVEICQGELVSARADLRHATELDPKNATAWADLGAACSHLGDALGAASALDRAVELAPTDAFVWQCRAEYRVVARDLEGALSDLNRSLELDPGALVAHDDRGRVRLNLGDLDGAIDDFSRAIELAPRHPFASLYSFRALAYARKGDQERALADAARGVELAPSDATPLLMKATIELEANRPEASIESCTRALPLITNAEVKADALASRAKARYRLGDEAGTLADATAAIELAPRRPTVTTAYQLRAKVRGKRQELDLALDDLGHSIELVPAADAFRDRATLFALKGDLDRALVDVARAIDLAPLDRKNVMSYVMRASLRMQKGDFDGAFADLDRASALDDKEPEVWRMRGVGLVTRGDRAQGKKALEHYLGLAPDASEAAHVRELLAELDSQR